MKEITTKVVKFIQPLPTSQAGCLEILGIDFMIDSLFNVYLIE